MTDRRAAGRDHAAKFVRNPQIGPLGGVAHDLLDPLACLGGLLLGDLIGEEEDQDVGGDQKDSHPRQTPYLLIFVADRDQHGLPPPRGASVPRVGQTVPLMLLVSR